MGNAESSRPGTTASNSLPPEEELMDAYDLFDTSGRGTVATKEMIILLRSFDFYPTEEDLKKALAEVDADGSGEVEFPEFCELINRLDRGSTFGEDEILEAFRYFDKEGTGFVDEPEMRRMLKNLANADEVDEMMSQVAVEMDGTINYVEFTRKLLVLP